MMSVTVSVPNSFSTRICMHRYRELELLDLAILDAYMILFSFSSKSGVHVERILSD